MPREAARLFLRVQDVRIEKLKDMTVDDVHHEGISIVEGAMIIQLTPLFIS